MYINPEDFFKKSWRWRKALTTEGFQSSVSQLPRADSNCMLGKLKALSAALQGHAPRQRDCEIPGFELPQLQDFAISCSCAVVVKRKHSGVS